MVIANASLAVNDGGLGISSALRRPVAVVGCSSAGTAATALELSTPDDVVTEQGYGPMPEVAALILRRAGGPVITVRAATVTAAVLGGYAQEGAGSPAAGTMTTTGTSTAVAALTGTADRPYAVKVVVTTAGANLAATPIVKVSLDGGVTYLATGSITASATPQAIGTTGLLLAFTDGTFVAADSFGALGVDSATTGDATGATVLSLSGTPLDAFDVRVKVTRAGATPSAGAAVKVSLDGGNSYGAEVSIASGSYVIPNTGITVAFSAATVVVGDIYRFKTSAPAWDTTSLGAALDALVTSGRAFEFVHICGPVDVTSATTVKTWLDAREAAGQYVAAVCETRDQQTGESVATWQTALTGSTPGFQTFSSDRMDVFDTHAYVESAIRAGVYARRNAARLLSVRLAQIPIHQHPGRVKTGPVEGLMLDGATSSVLHDHRTLTGLDLARLGGIQTVAGRSRGEYYFTARTMAPAGSDFAQVQRIRVMNEAATAGLAAISEYLGEDVELKTDGSGRIAEAEAKAIDAEVLAKVKAAVLNAPNAHVSAVSVVTNRTDNLAVTGNLRVAISVVPRGSIETVTATISYSLTA